MSTARFWSSALGKLEAGMGLLRPLGPRRSFSAKYPRCGRVSSSATGPQHFSSRMMMRMEVVTI